VTVGRTLFGESGGFTLAHSPGKGLAVVDADDTTRNYHVTVDFDFPVVLRCGEKMQVELVSRGGETICFENPRRFPLCLGLLNCVLMAQRESKSSES